MSNYRLLIQYEGTRYQGWQRQESTENTIQGRLEALLTKMCGTPVEIQGSGRTDAGVHALGQVANFHAETDMTCQEILTYINKYLPEDIGVIEVTKVSERFHSRLNAKGKTYCYRVWNSNLPCVFDRKFVTVVSDKLDVEAMRRAASYLTGTHDFKAFTSAKRGKKSTVRTIESIEITECGKELRFVFRGDGFLYHMVRNIIGTVVNVGLGNLTVKDFQRILASLDRKQASATAPACGLYLYKVEY